MRGLRILPRSKRLLSASYAPLSGDMRETKRGLRSPANSACLRSGAVKPRSCPNSRAKGNETGGGRELSQVENYFASIAVTGILGLPACKEASNSNTTQPASAAAESEALGCHCACVEGGWGGAEE